MFNDCKGDAVFRGESPIKACNYYHSYLWRWSLYSSASSLPRPTAMTRFFPMKKTPLRFSFFHASRTACKWVFLMF